MTKPQKRHSKTLKERPVIKKMSALGQNPGTLVTLGFDPLPCFFDTSGHSTDSTGAPQPYSEYNPQGLRQMHLGTNETPKKGVSALLDFFCQESNLSRLSYEMWLKFSFKSLFFVLQKQLATQCDIHFIVLSLCGSR